MKIHLICSTALIFLSGCGDKNEKVHLSQSEIINNRIIEFDNKISRLCSYGDNIKALTEAQKIFYMNQTVEREINNGGFGEYFYNSGGNYAHETLDALKRIGAVKTASIVEKSFNKFPHKKVPKERSERLRILQQIELTDENIWEELDEEFFWNKEDLNKLNIEFIKKNKNVFSSEQK